MADFTRFLTKEEQVGQPEALLNDEYKDLRRQHNIICMVGNGFDRALLSRKNFSELVGLREKSTSYKDFYKFLSGDNRYGIRLVDESNTIYAKMKDDIENHPEKEMDKWSNFEQTVTDLIFKNDETIDNAFITKIEEDLEQLGNLFSSYLNELLPVEILVEINKKAKKEQWAYKSFSEFLGDLSKEDYRKMHFTYRFTDFDHDPEYLKITDPAKRNKYKTEKRIKCNNTYNYDLYNYKIFNFNYTTLLDNYLYLDKGQFSPQISKIADNDRNFRFRIDPNDYIEKYFTNKNVEIEWSSYLLTDIIHPHGIKDIPRSFLFGTERKIDKITDPRNRFIKSFWGQNEKQYGRCFEDAELFIIFGMSLEICDGWWYDKIYEQLAKENSNAELIIYWHTNEEPKKMSADKLKKLRNNVKQRFIKGRTSFWSRKTINAKEKSVMERIYVVPFHENNTYFLGFNSQEDSEKKKRNKK